MHNSRRLCQSQHYRSRAHRVQDQCQPGVRYVKNSGIYETTPNVTQISGYVDVGTNMSMVGCLEAGSPKYLSLGVPLTCLCRLNGGPRCSSMIGLFQENGPCVVNADRKSTTLNPYSPSTVLSLIYIDQPIGTGFSYGTNTVNSMEGAALFVWTVFQVLFES
ncbi:carboxypeptidase D [Suillus clintonianus]|uniref:carboxypeptidase D n=1 Tax=Suillus clintonianus TaxID=1904413 RepID=UPI001B865C04|nr:carboxypeptidase D [Suillus clintonianus]KAG2116964.1 carboxypeptidase D [Suillus clintonianus]